MQADKPTFEEALADLETVVAELEGGQLGLDEALAGYERGVARLRRCHDLLERAERRIEVLSGFDAEGRPVTEPLDGGDEPPGEGESRIGRRSRVAPRDRSDSRGGSGAAAGGDGVQASDSARHGVDDPPSLF